MGPGKAGGKLKAREVKKKTGALLPKEIPLRPLRHPESSGKIGKREGGVWEEKEG